MIKDILVWPNSELGKNSESVSSIESIKDTLENMNDTLDSSGGIGISAPQIGILKRACIIKSSIGKNVVLVNPEIVDGFGEITVVESCLSVPGEEVYKKRALLVTVRYIDENGDINEKDFTSPESIIIQHEVDHLDGITIADTLPLFERRKVQKRLESA